MSERPRPKVSVIIPCYDQGAYLDDAVSSCVEAYGGPLEIIVVDDGSTDPRMDGQLAGLSVPPRAELRIVRQANGGLAHARNVGLRRSSGELVQFLDADDLLVRNKLEHQLRHLRLDPSVDVSVSDYYTSDESRTKLVPPPSSIAPFALSLEDFLFRWERGFSIPIHAALFRRRVFREEEPFPEHHRAKEDWLFWVRLKLRDVRLGYLPLRLCVYRLHGENMTASSARMGLDWIKAASRIDSWLAGRHPDFLEASLRWYFEWYLTRARSRPRPPARKALAPATEDPPATARSRAPRLRADAISVVVPIFNHAGYLRRCVLSVRDQTVAPREIVCVDDGSTDPAVRPILEALAAEIPELKVRFLERNVGIAAAQNLAVELAEGEFVAFLDCDDFLPPEALERMEVQRRLHPGVDYFFTDRLEVDAGGRLLRRAAYGGYPNRPDLDRVSHRDNLLDAMIASHLKVIRRSKILEVGGFDGATSGVQDWDLALKISECGELHYVPEALYVHRVHGASVTLGQQARMYRLTNQVRRRHQAIRTRRDVAPGSRDPLEDVHLLAEADAASGELGRWRRSPRDGAWQHEVLGTTVVRRAGSPRAAFLRWAASRATCFLLDRRASRRTLGFLREFNSYFDAIVCADEAQWTALHGCVWSPAALVLADELPRGRSSGDGPGAVTRRAS